MRHTVYLIKTRAGDVLETVPATFGIDSYELARMRLGARRLAAGDADPSFIYMVPESAARHVAPTSEGRWRTLGTSPSGKAMWECTSCGRMSITPDKSCPDGCAQTDADRIADLEARLRRSEQQRATVISAVVMTLDSEIARWRRTSDAFAGAFGGSMLAAMTDGVANELTRIRNLIAPAPAPAPEPAPEENIF